MGQPSLIYHDFQEQLEYSAELSNESSWIDFYRRLWPNMIGAIRIDAYSQQQLWGIDREILLPNGKRISIDEKKRKHDYGDLLLELWSVADFDNKTNTILRGIKPGWAIDPDKRCDFVAYAIPSVGKCYLLPFELTRITLLANLTQWTHNTSYYPKAARNQSYWTINIAVPWGEFKNKLCQQMYRKYGSAQELPLPLVNGSQLRFEWQ